MVTDQTQGAAVHGVSYRPERRYNGVHRTQLDLADTDATSRMIASVRPEVIFHLAGEVTGARDVDLVLPVFRSNLQSTISLLTAVTECEPASRAGRPAGGGGDQLVRAHAVIALRSR